MVSINQIHLALGSLLLATVAAVVAPQGLSTSPSTPSTSRLQVRGSSSVLHPIEGETVVYGSSYTIEWEPLDATGSVSIELWDSDEWAWGSAFKGGSNTTVTCDGWLVNSECAKIADSVPNSGSHVWNVDSNLSYETLFGTFVYYLAIYIQHSDDLPPSKSPPGYIESGNFTIAPTITSSTTNPGPSTSSGSSSATIPSSSSVSSSRSNTFLSSTTLSSGSVTPTGTGPTPTPTGNSATRMATDKLRLGALGLIVGLVI